MVKKKPVPPKEPKKKVPVVLGTVFTSRLDTVKPNTWNPNRLTPFEKKSLHHGFEHDGWLPSHALTIWRTDEKGKKKMLIVDGEHRWTVARGLGMEDGPMVFLDGITEAEAKAWTVKLDAKRGRFDDVKMAPLMKEIVVDMDPLLRSLDLGIEEDRLARYLDDREDVVGELPSGQKANVKQVKLSFTAERYEAFQKLVREMAGRLKTKTTTDTVLEVARRAGAAAAQK